MIKNNEYAKITLFHKKNRISSKFHQKIRNIATKIRRHSDNKDPTTAGSETGNHGILEINLGSSRNVS